LPTYSRDICSAKRVAVDLAIGTGVKVLLVAVIAAILVKHALRPVVETSSAVRKLGQGKLDTRIAVEGKMSVLGLISI